MSYLDVGYGVHGPAFPRRLGYIIGEPGAGKSMLMAALTEGLDRSSILVGSVPFDILIRPVVTHEKILLDKVIVAIELGRRRESFSGTDAMPMSVQPKVLAWLEVQSFPRVIGEGDRLTNLSFFHQVQDLGIEVHLVHVNVSAAIAAIRRRQRGSNQSDTWVKGRVTKIENIIRNWTGPLVHVDGTLSLGAQAFTLREHPVFGPLVEGLGTTAN